MRRGRCRTGLITRRRRVAMEPEELRVSKIFSASYSFSLWYMHRGILQCRISLLNRSPCNHLGETWNSWNIAFIRLNADCLFYFCKSTIFSIDFLPSFSIHSSRQLKLRHKTSLISISITTLPLQYSATTVPFRRLPSLLTESTPATASTPVPRCPYAVTPMTVASKTTGRREPRRTVLIWT